MYHICFSNPDAWEISSQQGVYGNKESGESSRVQLWGKIIDLTALKPGDKVFFYIKKNQYLKGVYEVVDEPYFCQDDLFQEEEKYPLRFNFKEVKNFDKPISISELASLIENAQLMSISSFERDVQGSFRGIRQITNDEGDLLENILHRLNPKSDTNSLTEYEHSEINDELELCEIIDLLRDGEKFLEPVKISFTRLPVKIRPIAGNICRYENALQGFIYYCLRRNLNDVIEDLELTNLSETLMEFPITKTQQHRSDILCVFRNENNFPHFYSFIELKINQDISIDNLSQLISYMKTFSISKKVSFNSIEGIFVSNSFMDETIDYLKSRKAVEKENPVRLIEYSVSNNGELSFNQIEI